MIYETLLNDATEQGIVVVERDFRSKARGLIKGRKIGIHKSMTTVEKGCVLAEELGHHHTGVGNVIDQREVNNIRQELRARQWAYVRVIPISRFLEAHEARISGRYDLAAYLGVTEEFLQETVDRYRDKYGLCKQFDDKSIVVFDPVEVLEIG